jgi:hypothetical protein
MKRISPDYFLKLFVPDRVDGPGIVGHPDLYKSAPGLFGIPMISCYNKPINESEKIIPNIRGITSQCSFPLKEYIIRVADTHNFNE